MCQGREELGRLAKRVVSGGWCLVSSVWCLMVGGWCPMAGVWWLVS